MDAKITKSRLGNFLAYEWIKIVLIAALCALLVVVILISCAVRVLPSQRFSVFVMYDVVEGKDLSAFDEKKVNSLFSYAILTGNVENIGSDSDGETVYSSRRAIGEGDVMFLSHVEGDENSTLKPLVEMERAYQIDPQVYLQKAETYLNGYFHGDFADGALDTAKAERAFYARNKGDNRFRTQEQQKAGVQLEIARLNQLKEDLKIVKESFADGLLSYTTLTLKNGNSVTCAINLSSPRLNRITSAVSCYKQEDGKTVQTNEGLQLIIFDNEEKDGELFYDTLSYLRYLVKTYGA